MLSLQPQLDQEAIAARLPGQDMRRRVKRRLVLALPVALLSLVTACGGSDTTSSGPSSSASSDTSSSSTSSSTSSAAADDGNTTLTGTVGEGDSFVITLMDSTGAPVTSIKAGTYTIKVKDASKIHNFHLTGAGVEETTTVPEVTDVTWTVELKAGSYTFKCDPHAKMTATFTVT